MPHWTSTSFDYESKILDKLPPQEEYHIGFYFGEKFQPINGVSGYADSHTIPDLLDYYHNAIYHYSINVGTNEEEFYSTYRAHWTASTPYKDYYFEQKKRTPDISDDAIRLNFIAAHNIEYIRIFKNASPSDYFLSHLTLWAEDEISGERFYAVNK
ncbi:hypothetical protein AGMMS49965_04100 [Bacteroidia bacterium]|nr:hypothetical protein AGMMS49965_04100 [Bacteroidia bacterium]